MWLMAALTFREAWRKKVVLFAGGLTLTFLALYGTGLHFFGSRANGNPAGPPNIFQQMEYVLLFVMGVYLASFLVAGLAILTAVGSVSGEIENGTLHALAARPLSRRALLLGKFAGQGAMLAVYAALFFLVLAGLVRWQLGLAVPALLPALGLFVLEPLVLLAVTTLGSVVFSTLGNGVLAFALYALAVVGGMTEQIGALVENPAAVNAGIVASLILPADAVYRRLVDGVVRGLVAGVPAGGQAGIDPQMMLGPFGVHSTPSDWMLVYAGVYVLGLLAAAVSAFDRRDI